jgi:outer membrane protein assembly factor BamB
MAVRLAVVFVAALIYGCSDNGGDSTPFLPLPQWARERADNRNSAFGSAIVANAAGGFRVVALSDDPITSTPVIGVDGNVFVATLDGTLFALSPELEILWQLSAADLGGPLSQLAVDPEDNVYFGGAAGIVACAGDGAFQWMTDIGSPVVGSPLLVNDAVDNTVQALFVGTADGRVLALGGPDGRIRWQVSTGGAVAGSLALDAFNLYAASTSGFLYTLTLGGATSVPPAPLGGVGPDSASAPSLLSQTIAVGGLTSGASGRLRGLSSAGVAPIWDAVLPGPLTTSPAQMQRSLVQVLANEDGTTFENVTAVTEYLAVGADGDAWLVDFQLGALGTRCIGGPDDQRPCRDVADCAAATTGSVLCEPIRSCVGGTNAGFLCRVDLAAEQCPEGDCVQITKCSGGDAGGVPCSVEDDCPGGFCDPSVFSVGAAVEVAPVFTGEGTLLVTATLPLGGGMVYGIDLPNTSGPLASTCLAPAPAFCRFAFPTAGEVIASPSVASDGTIYVGDNAGLLYAILDTPPS